MSRQDRATKPAEVLLTPESLDALAGLDLVARVLVQGFIAGHHSSPFVGSGEDFAHHRAYQQGDDLRQLDWRLYARTDRLYVRLFEEASNLQSFVLIDTTASMGFVGNGIVSKLRYAQFVAAGLAHLMLAGGDAVGLASVGDEPVFHLPPRNRPGHLHDLLLALEHMSANGNGRLDDGMDSIGDHLRRKGRVIVLSDFLSTDGAQGILSAIDRLRARGDEVMLVRILTPVELGEGDDTPGVYYDPEQSQDEVPGNPGSDLVFRKRVASYYAELEEAILEKGAEYWGFTTATPPVEALAHCLQRRKRSA